MVETVNLVIVGGGPAGVFAAITAKEINPEHSVLLLERTNQLLSKVRISGGGRCNVTHSCFDPKQLIQNYPRGGKELLGPFTRFQPRDTVEWFESRGVELKTEEDGRMFPVTDSSTTIIDCLLNEAGKKGVEIKLQQRIASIQKLHDKFQILYENGDLLHAEKLILATGSQPQGHKLAQSLGHTIQELVPSLFTFNIPASSLKDLSGISVDNVELSIQDSSYKQKGPFLITHWGFSGPASLKLSSWAARYLHSKNYQVTLMVNWLPNYSKKQVFEKLTSYRTNPQSIGNSNPFNIPKNLWKRFLELSKIDAHKKFSEISNDYLNDLVETLTASLFKVEGKTTNKEEFVTCGGVSLNEVNFKTMESKLCKNLYFAGEILDIDAVTGGFNFQNAWTTSWLAGHHLDFCKVII